jgi:hypothetical protein
MACFAAPLALGAATFISRKRFPEGWRVGWLNAMLLGGSAALAVEHAAHGELVPWPPFLTAAAGPGGAAAVMQEILTVGAPMALAVVLAWAALVAVSSRLADARKEAARPCR